MGFLKTIDLKAFYGKVIILKGVNLRVEGGEIVSVIGPNGAGKTTLLRAISRVVTTFGEISLNGDSLMGLSSREVIQKGVIHCPEGRQLFPNMRVRENLLMGAFLRRDKDGITGNLEHVYDLFPILRDRKKQLAGTLSGGEQQMLAIGRAIMSKPTILMLDEPSLGLAPLVIENIFKTIYQLNQDGITILLVEQNASLALEIAQRTYVLEEGNIVGKGFSKELLKDSKIRESYLGMT